jgi:hypothetical protein
MEGHTVMSLYGDAFDDEEDDDDIGGMGAPDPVDTVAGAGTYNPDVFNKIQQVRQGTSGEMGPPRPSIENGGLQGPPAPQAAASPAQISSPFTPTDLAAMDYAHSAEQNASTGRALNAVASGYGAKVDNSGYDEMVKGANTTADKVMDRSARIQQAIAARGLKEKAMADAQSKFGRQQDEKERHNKALEDAIRARVGAGAGKNQSHAMQAARQMIESSRGNQAVQQAEKDLYASSKLKSLFDKVGDLDKLSPEMSNLAVLEVAKMASGAAPDDHMLKMLDPSAYKGALAKAWEKVSNNPSPANAGAFLKQYKDYADSMTEDARSLITDRYGRIIDSAEDDIGKDNAEKLRDVYLRRFDKGLGGPKVLAHGDSGGGSGVPGVPSANASDGSKRQVVRTFRNKKTGQIKYVYSDGTEEIKP